MPSEISDARSSRDVTPFDGRAAARAGGRIGLVATLIGDALAATPIDGVVEVLDCGGGSGAYAVPLALGGADVTVIDISADALATLRRRADEQDVSSSIHAVAGEVESLGQLLGGPDEPARTFDVVLAHGILDAVDPVEATFAAMAAAVRPGGLLSVLVANPIAAVLARAVAGEPVLALQEFRRLDDPSQIGPDAIAALGAGCGLVVEAQYGVGVFSDLVQSAAGEALGGRIALAELDAAAASRPPFSQLAGRIHLLLRRPV